MIKFKMTNNYIANPINITPNSQASLLGGFEPTKQSRKVIRNGLLRRITPTRNDTSLLWLNANRVSYKIIFKNFWYMSCCLLRLSVALLPFWHLTSLAVYTEPTAKTNVNKVDPLFNEKIENYKGFEQVLEKQKTSAVKGAESETGFNDLVGSKQARTKGAELSNIRAEELEGSGIRESFKEAWVNEYLVDYSRPGMVRHKDDANRITEGTGQMMSSLLGFLKKLDIDCKQVKGNKEIEPQYYIQLITELDRNKGDTVYDKTICEELRNKYRCIDELVLQCLQFAEKTAELTINGSNINYHQSLAGSVKRISFAEKYGSGGGTSSYGGGTVFFGLINKSKGTTHSANEVNWYIDFNVSTNVLIINRLQLTDLSYGTFIMIKLNGTVIFVGPNGGNNLFLNGYREVKTKGRRKYVGVVGRRVNIVTSYPIVNTGVSEYALGVDSVVYHSGGGVVNLLPHVRQGANRLEIKAISLGANRVSFNLDVSERICLNWQENWSEKCILNITQP
ncbi:MAG: hypothetical protein LN561_04875 [Rickettsia endosymbiont of Labidopullus appendiculatus]|nr:hypothetical protein [Rickettsia endosymbiont of Labidopullus appendiculatus]